MGNVLSVIVPLLLEISSFIFVSAVAVVASCLPKYFVINVVILIFTLIDMRECC